MNLAKELKRKRDAEHRFKETAGKNLVYDPGSGEYSSGGITVTEHSILDHEGIPGVGNAFVFRKEFTLTDVIVVNHNLGKRPIVQVVGNSSPAYGEGAFGAGAYGGDSEPTVVGVVSIIHNSVNQLTVTLTGNDTGEVICVG